MKDKEEQIDWERVTDAARDAFGTNTAVINWTDFLEGYLSGYRQAFEEYR